MSRIGRKPIQIPKGVEVNINTNVVTIKGPKGTLTKEFSPLVKISKQQQQIICSIDEKASRQAKALYGLTRSLINNMVIGVTNGFTKELDVIGLGYKVKSEGNKIIFNVGYSHPVVFEPPKDVVVKVEPGQKAGGLEIVAKVVVSGIDKELVGQVAANIRAIKPPCVYKGTGIRYSGEKVIMKEGKKVAA